MTAEPRLGVRMDAEAGGNARIYQVGHGTLNVYDFGGHTARAAAVVAPVAGHQVAAPAGFVGRTDQVAELADLLDPAGPGAGVTVVSAVAGLAGVGKTALAGHVAGIAVGRGWFPGGAVFTDLHGYDDPVEAEQVFAPLLRALGVPGDEIPPVPDEQATTYHQVLATLAGRGRPVLLVLDNASAASQVRPLLPVHRAHRVLVTSRHTLGELDGVRVIDLDVLGAAEAVALLDSAVRVRHPGDARIGGDPAGAGELARLCGGLPLALRIVAALLADDPALTPAELAAELTDAGSRLDALSYGERAVAGAFELSWRHLVARDAQAARLFRLLAVNPGPEVGTEAAAAIADVPVHRARGHLRALHRAHLVEPGTAAGRWRMHDLVALYTARLDADPDDRPAATGRLLGSYLDTARAADEHLRALPGDPVPDRFTGRDGALAWFDAERPNLVAAVGLAVDIREWRVALDLAGAVTGYLSRRRYLADSVTTASAAVSAATETGDPDDEEWALTDLGNAFHQVRRLDEAIAVHERCRALCRDTGDREGEAVTLGNLGAVLRDAGRLDEAISSHRQAVEVFREVGDRRNESLVLVNLGVALAGVRRFDEAAAAFEQGAARGRETGDREAEGSALNNLGAVLAEADRYEEAIAADHSAAAIFAETGNRYGEGMTLNNLGLALRELGRPEEAVDAHQRAAEIFTQVEGGAHSEALTVGNLGLALRALGRLDEAEAAHRRAAGMFRETGDGRGTGRELSNLGTALLALERREEALACWAEAVEAFEEVGATSEAEDVRGLIRGLIRGPTGGIG